MIAGIQRVVITPTPNNWRFKEAMLRWPMTYDLYRRVFADLNIPLANGIEEIECSKEEAFARLDWQFGVDVILTWPNGMRATMQEKLLGTNFETLTVEYMNDPNADIQGDWFEMSVNYYFVGYSKYRQYPYWDEESLDFWCWGLYDWAAIQRQTCKGNIPWRLRQNRPPARANFYYIRLRDIPANCTIGREYPHG